VFDREIGRVRKVTSGTGDVNPTTGSISRAVDAACCNDPRIEQKSALDVRVSGDCLLVTDATHR